MGTSGLDKIGQSRIDPSFLAISLGLVSTWIQHALGWPSRWSILFFQSLQVLLSYERMSRYYNVDATSYGMIIYKWSLIYTWYQLRSKFTKNSKTTLFDLVQRRWAARILRLWRWMVFLTIQWSIYLGGKPCSPLTFHPNNSENPSNWRFSLKRLPHLSNYKNSWGLDGEMGYIFYG